MTNTNERIHMPLLVDFNAYPVKNVLDTLLQDKSTKQNIIYATDAYVDAEPTATEMAPILAQQISGETPTVCIVPRVQKNLDEQTDRTKAKAEVFTPSWMVNQMVNNLDEEWFGRKHVFNTELEDHSWIPTEGEIAFPSTKKHDWHDYVDSRRLEITCGDAPFLVSRYDAATGAILPISQRIGLLDRKLRIVDEHTEDDLMWWKWTLRAFQSVYGYEFQGDSLLIARANLLLTFVDHYRNRFGTNPDKKHLKQIANVIVWNLWQMDGLTETIPFHKPPEKEVGFDMLDMLSMLDEPSSQEVPVFVRLYDWRAKTSLSYSQLLKGAKQ